MLTLYFVRSPIAHATIRSIDVKAAREMPGVVGVYSADDLDFPDAPALMMLHPAAIRPSLAKGTVNFVGDPVVVVVAESRALAMDAAELVEIDYEPLGAGGRHGGRARTRLAAPVRGDRQQRHHRVARRQRGPARRTPTSSSAAASRTNGWPWCPWRGVPSPSIRPAPISTSPCISPARCRTWSGASSPGCWASSRSGCG